jgi:DNA-binding PadR family transcriptional regulator
MERELLLLGLLRHGDMHGYQLHEFINQYLSSCTDLKKSTAYFLLGKMAERGWIVETEVQDGNRPARRVYHVTEAGEAVFQTALRDQLALDTPTVFPGDTALAFIDQIPPDEARTLLQDRRDSMAARRAALDAAPAHPGAWQFLLEHQRRHLDTELVWLDEVLSQI